MGIISNRKQSFNEYTRSDLALEMRGDFKDCQFEKALSSARRLTVTRQAGERGERYVTLSFGRITELSASELEALTAALTQELVDIAAQSLGRHPDSSTKVLAVGLGNSELTADAIGPDALKRVCATRNLRDYNEEMYLALGCCELSCIAPGVLGKTGIESAEIVRSVSECSAPDLIVAIDALAARSPERLASTIQLSDGGIAPGAGIGNTRVAIDKNSMGCPVISVGVPTVVNSSTLVYDALGQAGIGDGDISESLREVLQNGKSFVVSPKDADTVTETVSALIAEAINRAFGISDT